jgi:4-amino-4-deoxy-L-arabinose transferase-like glycosyltransferase
VLWIVLIGAPLTRLATLGLYPLMDSTEARYAEIARKMFELGDWITPWFNFGEPFWGKPPLSFWMTAASFEVFGPSGFAARLPHWLCGVVVAWSVWNWLAARSRREAIFALALLSGSALFFVAAGAVMTDMSLALGTTLAMRGFWLALHGPEEKRLREEGLFFLGIAIGLLAKGPVALVLTGIPVLLWALSTGGILRVLRGIHWTSGTLLTLFLVVPWYALAEWRTPGFLQYFLIGEHWQRFVDAGWQGDLYGSAHVFPHGSIWLFALLALLPWSLLVPAAAIWWRRADRAAAPQDRSLRIYLLLWALTPLVFFSVARNILWTYVLPAAPALVMLTALWLARLPDRLPVERVLAGGVTFTALTMAIVVATIHFSGLADTKSTQALVSDYQSRKSDGEALVFLGGRPFSSAFYSQGQAEAVSGVDELQTRIQRGPLFVAVDGDDLDRLSATLRSRLKFVSQRGDFRLFHSGSNLTGTIRELYDHLGDRLHVGGHDEGLGENSSTTRRPGSLSVRVIAMPWSFATAPTSESPRPLPAVLRLRSRRKKR